MKSYRSKPSHLLQYEVLMRRAMMDEKAQQELKYYYHSLRYGYVGERKVDNEWREVNVQGHLWHDFTCRNSNGNTHQIDTLFICQHFILVVEIKNVSGRIDFDDARRQFLRTREDGKVESFNNPIDQVKRHRDFIAEVSLDWPFYVPVEAFVVIANPSTVIGRISNEIPVFNVSGLRTKVAELAKKYASVRFNPRTVRTYLEQLYEPIERKVCVANYNIRKGVLCNECGNIMHHSLKGFMCSRCGKRDIGDAALRRAMFDYRILYDERIRNREFREFVGVESPRTANEMLRRICTKYYGEGKARVYLLDEKETK